MKTTEIVVYANMGGDFMMADIVVDVPEGLTEAGEEEYIEAFVEEWKKTKITSSWLYKIDAPEPIVMSLDQYRDYINEKPF